MKSDRLRTVLIVLTAAALALGVLTAFVVFYPTGSYQPVVYKGNGPTAVSTSSSTATSTASSTGAAPGAGSGVPGQFSSEYTAPYPVTWNEGGESIAITGASFAQNQLTLALAITIGNSADCVPVNVALVTDESGTLKTPDRPSGSTFIFPDTQSCNGTQGATYSQSVVFTVDPSLASPYLFTTGGAANLFFNVATNTANGVDVALPSRSG